MLKEQGRVVSIEDGALWVETIQQSTCGTCAAQKGCGQSLLSKMGSQPTLLRVLLSKYDSKQYNVNDSITIGIPEHIVVGGSLFVYLLPLLFMVVFSGISQYYLLNEMTTIFLGLVGFILGGLCIRYHSRVSKNDPCLQPVLISELPTFSVAGAPS